MKCAVIFGGTGFVGTYFARYLAVEENFEKVYLYDQEPISEKHSLFRRKMLEPYLCIHEVTGDVREPIAWVPPEAITLVANFAAVHREPGHEDYEYYECNLLGAKNVCDWAERVGCETILFTSSIAPYGPSEEPRDERSLSRPSNRLWWLEISCGKNPSDMVCKG